MHQMRNGVWCITIHTTQHTAHAHTRARAEARGNFSFLLSSPLPSFPLFSPLLSPPLSSPLLSPSLSFSVPRRPRAAGLTRRQRHAGRDMSSVTRVHSFRCVCCVSRVWSLKSTESMHQMFATLFVKGGLQCGGTRKVSRAVQLVTRVSE